MDYQVLALKYRPARFEEVVGQEQVTSVLQGALSQRRIANAYLFSGPRGCGKTTVARLLAKALNCEEGPSAEPCGECDSCRSIAQGSSLAVIEIDAASNRSIDDIRRIREEAGYASVGGRYKVYIVDEAHQITGDAANAFLKTLEEPPPSTVFILATTEPQKIIATVHSRCQRFGFRLLSTDEIAGRLAAIIEREGLSAEMDVLRAVARRADGSMRDGLTLLDQALASLEGALTLETVTEILGLTRNDRFHALTEAWLERDGARAVRELDAVLAGGLAIREFALGLSRWFRSLLLLKLDPALVEGEMSAADRERAQGFAEAFQTEDLLYLVRFTGERADQIRYASQPRILLETLVVELARFESRVLLTDVLARLNALEGGAAPRSAPPQARGSRRGGPAPGGGDTPRETRPGTRKPEARGREAAPRGTRAASPAGQAGATAQAAPSAEVAPSKLPPGEQGFATVWGDFVRRVGRGKKSLASFLDYARPGPLGAKHFTICVENPFHLAMLDTPDHLRLLSDTFAAAYGEKRQVRVELVQGEIAPPAERISQERADDAKRKQDLRDHAGDDLIQDLLKRFDGEVLED